jgi:hypothetical protein
MKVILSWEMTPCTLVDCTEVSSNLIREQVYIYQTARNPIPGNSIIHLCDV